jgi:hypothetical protein
MKERPILMSDTMVRAILDGRKTQTRRVVKPQPDRAMVAPHCENGWWMWRVWTPEHAKHGYPSTRYGDVRCPYGVPGDRLWVRETWAPHPSGERTAFYAATLGGLYVGGFPEWDGPWKPSIHMPRWASRITLEVVNVRVERLQDISEADAQAEGCDPAIAGHCEDGPLRTYRTGFVRLWDNINAERATWASNPWVWVVEFKRI